MAEQRFTKARCYPIPHGNKTVHISVMLKKRCQEWYQVFFTSTTCQVGGLEHVFFPFSWECHHPNWRTHIFQRARSTTNQIIIKTIIKSYNSHILTIINSILTTCSCSQILMFWSNPHCWWSPHVAVKESRPCVFLAIGTTGCASQIVGGLEPCQITRHGES